jgi:hypothetical protein
MPKDEKNKRNKFLMPWDKPFKVGKVYNNKHNNFHILISEELKRMNTKKLKSFQIPKPTTILVAMICVISSYKEILNPWHAFQTKSRKL